MGRLTKKTGRITTSKAKMQISSESSGRICFFETEILFVAQCFDRIEFAGAVGRCIAEENTDAHGKQYGN